MSHSHVTWLVYIWHDVFVRVTRVKRRHMNESRLIWGNIEMSHVLYDTSEEATAQSGLCLMRMGYKLFWRDMTHLYVTWLVYMGHDLFVRVTRVKRQRRNWSRASCKWDRSCLHVTWLTCTWHDSFIRDMTHHMRHDSFICVTRGMKQRRN